jgi:hypothetical protein
MKTKLLVSALLFAGLVFFTNSCTKERDPHKCCCTYNGTVALVPVGCVIPPNGFRPMGIVDENGKFHYVSEDATGKFKNYKQGDKVSFDYTTIENCSPYPFTSKGIMAVEVNCIKLTCLKDPCNSSEKKKLPKNDCKVPDHYDIKAYSGRKVNSYRILEHRVEGTKYILKVGYSGCQEADMEMIFTKKFNGGENEYVCKLDYDETMCEMYLTKEICFDKATLSRHIGSMEIETQNQGVIKLQ